MNSKNEYPIEIDRTTNWRALVEWYEEGALDWNALKSIVVQMIKVQVDRCGNHAEANHEIAEIIFANDREGAVKWAKNLTYNDGVKPVEYEIVGWMWPGDESVRGFSFGPTKPDERAAWVPVYESAYVKGVQSKPLTEEINYVLDCNRVSGTWPMSVTACRKILEDFLEIRNNPIGK